MQTRRLVFLAVMLGVSVVLNIVERTAVQGFSGLPMIRLGLANIVVLILLYTYGRKDAFSVLILRIVLVGFVTGLLSPSFLLSFSGGMVAFALMNLFKRLPGFSIISVSVMGSLGHAVGQIFMAIFILETSEIVYILPILTAISIPTGIFIGLVARKLIALMKDQFALSIL
ncbi:MAG: Gx transporter family protein [Bacillota bacterium]